MRDPWDRRVERARRLADNDAAARPLLTAYAALLGLQRDCFRSLTPHATQLTGSIEADLQYLRPSIGPMLAAVASTGPPQPAAEAGRLLAGSAPAIDSMLLAAWGAVDRAPFFAKLILQPYAEQLAAANTRPRDRGASASALSCPFCGGAPQLSVLENASSADGGGRRLTCATCATAWPVRRVLCPHCGEEDERRLCYYRSEAVEHVRVDACDTCRRYLKAIDLTRLGLAVPLVDEVAAAPLDLWAVEQGYEKIELNLIGL